MHQALVPHGGVSGLDQPFPVLLQLGEPAVVQGDINSQADQQGAEDAFPVAVETHDQGQQQQDHHQTQEQSQPNGDADGEEVVFCQQQAEDKVGGEQDDHHQERQDPLRSGMKLLAIFFGRTGCLRGKSAAGGLGISSHSFTLLS